MATIYQAGYVFKDDGTAVSGASVQLFQADTTTTVGSASTTDSNGYWALSTTTEHASGYDVKITSGSSIRYRRGNDKLQIEELDIRNDTGNGQGGLLVANTTNNASNKVATFANRNTTRADGDEIYISFELNDDGGNIHEFARMTAEAVDVTNGQEDGQFRFGVSVDGTMTDVFTINSSESGGTDMNLDVSGDLTLDADGGDIFFKDGGTTFGSATNNSGNLIIKSGTTTALTFSGANVTLGGSATVTTLAEVGSDTDKIIMSDSGVLKFVTGANLRSYIGAGTGDGDITGVTITADDTNTASDTAGSADFTVAGGSGLTSSVSGTTITIAGDNASTSAKGVAQFSSDNFAASSGTITIKDGGVVTAEIAADAVTGAKIADDAIGSEHIADDAITSALIADGAVTTALIGADAVTNAKIADDAINSEHYTDGSIDTAHIADDQVTLAKMAGLARGKLIVGDASGNPSALAVGSANYVLTSDGTDTAWAAAAAGGISAGKALAYSIIF